MVYSRRAGLKRRGIAAAGHKNGAASSVLRLLFGLPTCAAEDSKLQEGKGDGSILSSKRFGGGVEEESVFISKPSEKM